MPWRCFVTLRDESGAAEGEIPVTASDGECGHSETICYECVESWLIDHHVRWQRVAPVRGSSPAGVPE